MSRTAERVKEGGRCPVRWEEVQDDFIPDGAWRDVYVFETTVSDWQSFIDMLRERRLPLRFFVDGQDAPLPTQAEEIFALRKSQNVRLSFGLVGLDLACHFFTEDELEFDLDPETVDEDRFNELVDFMVSLGDRLMKDVVLTYENAPAVEILRYSCEIGLISLGNPE